MRADLIVRHELRSTANVAPVFSMLNLTLHAHHHCLLHLVAGDEPYLLQAAVSWLRVGRGLTRVSRSAGSFIRDFVDLLFHTLPSSQLFLRRRELALAQQRLDSSQVLARVPKLVHNVCVAQRQFESHSEKRLFKLIHCV